MSRCFPLQSRGYKKKGSTCMTLIESIKLQSEKNKSRPERNKEKRDRKQKKEGRKYKEQRTRDDDEVKEPSLKFNRLGSLNICHEESSVGGYLLKAKDDECEILERSGITEEFEEPGCSKDPVYLSDSSKQSKKRKRESSLSVEKEHGNGRTVIKIRLRKHEEPEALQHSELIGMDNVDAPSVSSYKDWNVQGGRESQPAEIVGSVELAGSTKLFDESFSGHKTSVKKNRGIVETYELLSENWPPAIGMELTNLDDQDWLICAKKHITGSAPNSVKYDCDNDLTGCRNSSLWPRAHLLPEWGIYALPYTVPL